MRPNPLVFMLFFAPFALLTLSSVCFAYDSPMARACLEWLQRGAKKRNDMMIILLLFCASCAFLWPFITLVAAMPRWVLRGYF
jgi:hypothetical protein